jgi:hypothetical protein
MPVRFYDVKDSTFSRQSAHRWRWSCQPHASAAALLPRSILFVSDTHLCYTLSKPQGLVRLEERIILKRIKKVGRDSLDRILTQRTFEFQRRSGVTWVSELLWFPNKDSGSCSLLVDMVWSTSNCMSRCHRPFSQLIKHYAMKSHGRVNA